MVTRRAFVTGAATAGIAMTAGCNGSQSLGGYTGDGDGAEGVAETSSVSMSGSQFSPRNIHVDVGTSVLWSNDDTIEHTVTSASDNWEKDSQVESGGETTHTFEESGVYDVYCSYHGDVDLSGMSMKVGVGDATIASPLGGGADDDGTTEGADETETDDDGMYY